MMTPDFVDREKYSREPLLVKLRRAVRGLTRRARAISCSLMKLMTLGFVGAAWACSALAQAAGTFGDDVTFLREHTALRVLQSADGRAQIAVAPAWQGRVMTSTAGGVAGNSYGWINYETVKRGIVPASDRQDLDQHIYVFGGEERLWLGPEGGQFAIFFKPGEKHYTFDNWHTPALVDTDPFEVTAATTDKISLRKSGVLHNNSGAEFSVRLERTVRLLDRAALGALLGAALPENVSVVGYQTENSLINAGTNDWHAGTGALSIWLLGMLKHGPHTVVAIPVRAGEEKWLGPQANTDYFGAVGPDRLKLTPAALFFKADGNYRSKIGIPPKRCLPVCGSYDPDRRSLTLLQFNLPDDAAALPYVKSQWKIHAQPYAGDVINAYNDGAPEPGAKPLGPFYEIESSSPALPLKAGASLKHVQRTIHLEGDAAQLAPIAKQVLGVELAEIQSAFP